MWHPSPCVHFWTNLREELCLYTLQLGAGGKHYQGFQCPDEFVVGYGMDYAEQYRCLPYIGVLKPHIFTKNWNCVLSITQISSLSLRSGLNELTGPFSVLHI
ncbi:hypothetical protein R1flu_016863 [Riccia fluitans]|uniref:Uncharacterized protein n=1 Tax=Riccia fluitans TaxID=41844 RepID=A0ABD1YN26_9MARC